MSKLTGLFGLFKASPKADPGKLLTAAEQGNLNTMRQLLRAGSAVDERGGNKETPLMRAAKYNKMEAVQLLLDWEGDIEAKDTWGQTALMYAAEGGNLEMIRFLLKRGADITVQAKGGGTALTCALKHAGAEAAVDFLFENYPKDLGYQGCLIAAAKGGYTKIVRKLIELGLDVDEKDNSKETALLHAIYGYDRGAVTEFLLAQGADIEARGYFYKDTPLIRAAQHGTASLVKLLVNKGADIHAADRDEKTALIHALEHGYGSEMVEFLFAVDKKAPYTGCLAAAAQGGYIDIARQWIQHGADVNETGGRLKDTPLIRAAEYHRADMTKLFLDSGADIEAKDDRGRTALIRAVESGSFDVVKLLVERGADINAADTDGKTALIYALTRSNADIAEFLLNRGAKYKGCAGCLTAAAESGNIKMAQLMLSAGADINERAGYRYGYQKEDTPLLRAASTSHVEMVQFLLNNGADLEARGEKGRTPLIRAIEGCHVEMVQFLIGRGADLTATDNEGKSVLAYAEAHPNKQMAAIVKNAPPDPLAEIIAKKDCNLARDFFDAAFWNDNRTPVAPRHLKMALLNGDKPMMRLLIHWGAVATQEDLEAWSLGDKNIQQKYRQALRQCGWMPKN